MSAPATITTVDLSGKWLMNKSKSDSTDEILRLQGVGWLTRKAIAMSSLTLAIKHYKDDDGVEHIDIDQTLSGGVSGTTELRVLDWEEHKHEDHIFGAVIGKSRRIKVDEIDNEYLKRDWLPDVAEHGAIHSYVQSDTEKSGTTWIAEQIWGFEVVDGERRYARHISFTGPGGEHIDARLVYDYLGPV
ncbi:hypothetical protein PLICRDRAFT_36026 [Plicaturopsis crispa FD-325 SS-3]|nr:hypothetical protein PLICRDRAFT_36026 [Plicaturopsis crispa FD-325 SS-3]